MSLPVDNRQTHDITTTDFPPGGQPTLSLHFVLRRVDAGGNPYADVAPDHVDVHLPGNLTLADIFTNRALNELSTLSGIYPSIG